MARLIRCATSPEFAHLDLRAMLEHDDYRALTTSEEGLAYLKKEGFDLPHMHVSDALKGLTFFIWVGANNVGVFSLDELGRGLFERLVERLGDGGSQEEDGR